MTALGLRKIPTTKMPSAHFTRPRNPASIPERECGEVVRDWKKKYSNVRGPICRCLNESQLLDKLKDIGGYNPRYVAVNSSEACNFVNLIGDVQSPSPITPPPRRPLPGKLPLPSARDDNALGIAEEDKISHSRQKRMVPLTPGTIIHGCWSESTFIGNTNRRRMCTECSATTRLEEDIFPLFINEIICDQNDNGCLLNLGQCVQRFLKFPFLQRTGNFVFDPVRSSFFGVDIYVEEWIEIEREISSCCECQAFSFLGR